MSDSREDLVKKLKTLPQKELLAYESAAVNTSRFISIFGVMCLFVMVSFPTALTILPGAILTYILANVGTGIDITLNEIRTQLRKFDK